MFKPVQLNRWQLVLAMILGAIAGVFLLSVTRAWISYGVRAINYPSLYLRDPLGSILEIWVSLWGRTRVVTPIIVGGTVLGALTAFVEHRRVIHPQAVGQVCLNLGSLVALSLVVYNSWVLITFATRGFLMYRPVLPAMITYTLDPGLIWSLFMLRWGYVLSKQQSVPIQAVHSAAQ